MKDVLGKRMFKEKRKAIHRHDLVMWNGWGLTKRINENEVEGRKKKGRLSMRWKERVEK